MAELFADIEFGESDSFTPIGINGFTGTFVGNGHAISGLNFGGDTYTGLFVQNSGTIKELAVVDVTFTEGSTGGICQSNTGTIENCFFVGKTEGSTSLCGNICQTDNGTVSNCYYMADSENDDIEGTTAKTAEQFKSGEVAWLLNGGATDGTTIAPTDGTQLWYQALGENGDKRPVGTNTGANTVYQVKLLCGGVTELLAYSNTNDKIVIAHDYTGEPSFDSTKKIYVKTCNKDGCNVVIGYYADENGTIEATLSDGVYHAAYYPLTDATPYNNKAVFTAEKFTYTRTFPTTNWATWYVPFELKLTEEICAKYDFSRINNVHQYDTDGDGNADKTVVESFRLMQGVNLEANYPYLVKPKTNADLDMTITLHNVVPAFPTENSVSCASMDYIYTFRGTYSEMGDSGEGTNDPYTLHTDGQWYHFYSLDPMRHYLAISSRNESQASVASLRSIMLSVIGEEDATGVVNIYSDERKATETYDLGGRLLPEGSQQQGLLIKNGKVILNKQK